MYRARARIAGDPGGRGGQDARLRAGHAFVRVCDAENRPGRKFCAACGQSLPAACPACGFENAPDDRFCGGCGKPLDATEPPPAWPPETAPGEIRPVTVMFVDISGYTALSGRLDAEDTHGLLTRFFETVDAIVLRFGGRIDKHIGDSVMALFGAPVSHGNDPERAMLAATAVHAAMPALSGSVGETLKVHIGIATGEVIASGLGSSAHSAYTVIGDAVNLAARLMERAGPEETLASTSVWEAAGDAARTAGLAAEPLGAVAFRGIARPVEICRIVAQDASALKTVGVRPLVGRSAELALLASLMDSALHGSHGSVVVLRGEPGIGKTRLADALFDLAAERGFGALKALVLDFGTGRGGKRRARAGQRVARGAQLRAGAARRTIAGGRRRRIIAGGRRRRRGRDRDRPCRSRRGRAALSPGSARPAAARGEPRHLRGDEQRGAQCRQERHAGEAW